MDHDRRQLWLDRLRRVLRIAGRIVGAVLLVVVLIVAAVLLLPAGRNALLDEGLELAAGALPGELTVRRSEWPGLGRLELDGLVWTDGADTLARADTLRLQVDISDLVRRDLTVRRVLAAGILADVPAIQARFPAPADTAAADTASAGPPPFPRPGNLPPIPSIAVERLALRRVTVVAAPEQVMSLDSLAVAAELRHGRPLGLEAALRGNPHPELSVAWRLEGSGDADSLRVDVSPLLIDSSHEVPDPGSLPLSGHLALPVAMLDSLAAGHPPLWPGLTVSRLSIGGDVGTWTIDARLAGREPGFLAVESTLPTLPRTTLAAFAGARTDSLAPGLIDTLQARWARGGEPGLRLKLDIEPPPAPRPHLASRLAVDGGLRLPPLASLAPLLPPQLDVEELGPIIAALSAHYDGLAQPPHYDAHIDLGETAWIDAALIDASGDTTAARLDSLRLRLPGLSLAAEGAVDRDSLRLALRCDLLDGSLLRHWQDPALAELEPQMALDLQAAGPWPLPGVDLEATASLQSPRLSLPQLVLSARAAPDTILLDLALPEGLTAPQRDLSLVSLRFEGAAGDSLRALRGALRAEAREKRGRVLLAAYLDTHELTTAPAGSISVDSLSLALDEVGLANPEPFQITFSLADSTLDITNLALGGELGELGLEAHAADNSVTAQLDLALQLASETLKQVVPQAALPYLPEATLTTDGDLDLAGPASAPWVNGAFRVAFADNPDLGGIALRSRVAVGGRGQPPPELEPGPLPWRETSARLQLSLSDADTVLTSISALVPLPYQGVGRDSVELRLDAESMDLNRIEPLLPLGITIKGRLDADTRVAGMMEPGEASPDLSLSGGLSLTDLRLGAADGSWMAAEARIDLEGSSRTPVVRGGVDISGGLIRLPEPPPSLLPAEGEALLWDAAAASTDTLATAAAAEDSTEAEPELPGIVPDLTFNIHCPGSLWLRGQGLDIELSGDLDLRLENGIPLVEGELEARQGTMKQLGRIFKLQRGRIIFYADYELNPELDLVLAVRVNSYDITITLSGTANEPTLEFGSSPDLSDGDIISVLLFGKTSDELDEGQSGLMAERAAQVAIAYGSVELQERLAKQLGVDVLSIAPSSGDNDKSSLTVGKYLNPKVMVRYEQVLSEESAFYVHLDYALTESQDWKLHSQVSQGEASGVEVKWEKDW